MGTRPGRLLPRQNQCHLLPRSQRAAGHRETRAEAALLPCKSSGKASGLSANRERVRVGRGSLWLSRENSLRKGQGLLSTAGEDDQGSSLLQSLQPTQQAQMSQRERKLLRKRKRK